MRMDGDEEEEEEDEGSEERRSGRYVTLLPAERRWRWAETQSAAAEIKIKNKKLGLKRVENVRLCCERVMLLFDVKIKVQLQN